MLSISRERNIGNADGEMNNGNDVKQEMAAMMFVLKYDIKLYKEEYIFCKCNEALFVNFCDGSDDEPACIGSAYSLQFCLFAV